MFHDIIVAPITGMQPAAVAIVRISGSGCWGLASSVFGNWPAEPVSHQAVYGRFKTGDDGLALPFPEGHSYTGEETVEFSIHGSMASVQSLVALCVTEGARMAEPGEFTQRAFMNGRMDLSQAEGVRDTIEASTEAQLRQANLHRSGLLHARLVSIASVVSGLLVRVEASVDFSEEIGPFDRFSGLKDLAFAIGDIEEMLSTASAGRIIRQGLRIAIVGPPNAGKSSLLNALLGTDRAIVTDIPGTTRDYVEERADIAGVPCVLIDTAGLRESSDVVELLGIQRSHAMAANADEIWYVYDASDGFSASDESICASFTRPVLVLANKSDLTAGDRGLSVSALTREGFAELFAHVMAKVEGVETVPFINQRHEGPLSRALESLRSCLKAMEHDMPDDLISVGLRDALNSIGEITGETATEDVIERIFRDFCIGK